ncbi:MAG: hypothetical protein RL732_537 [Bacteroidota bacterium]
MKILSFLLFLGCFCTVPVLSQTKLPVSPHFKIQQLAPGVWAAINNNLGGHAICNAGIIDLGNKTVVFDPFMNLDAAADLKKAALLLTGRMPSLVINSHGHNDHIRGNQVFLPATVMSSRSARDEMAASEPKELKWEKENAPAILAGYRNRMAKATTPEEKKELLLWIRYFEGMVKSGPYLKTTLPDLTFTDSLWIYGSKRSIKLIEYPQAHTPGDVALFLPESGIVFSGDMLFTRSHPWLSDGDPDRLNTYLQEWLSNTLLKTFVPGHGEVGDRSSVLEMQYYIKELKALVKTKKEAGIADSVIIRSPIPDAYAQWTFGRRFFEANVAFLCNRN